MNTWRSHASTKSLMLLVERLIKAIRVVVSIVIVPILLGVESKTALAAPGAVGVALALGAQKTVENLLGGVFLLSDKALAVSDYCTIGNQSGTARTSRCARCAFALPLTSNAIPAMCGW